MRVNTPYNYQVPKDIRENLRWRANVHSRVMDDVDYADMIREACSQDPLFFVNGFGWTHDPRQQPFTKLPFVLYEYQERAILEIIEAINSHDLLIEKSRDTGASWMNLVSIFWCWLFKDNLTFLLGSRVQDDVDNPGNPKALFYKLDFFFDNLPHWLSPVGYDRNKHRRHLHIENPERGGTIDGEATTKDFARGARCTAILLDEFASVENGSEILSATRDATRCRLFNSTPKGVGNAFYDVRQKNTRRLRIHWSGHPEKAKGLYTADNDGKLSVLDPVGYPKEYTPILDGKVRSPWYDGECERATTAREIAQELDINYLGSGGQFFDAVKIQEHIRNNAMPPMLVGDLEYDATTGDPIKFRESTAISTHQWNSGKLRLWCMVNKDGKPSTDHKIVIGNDVAAGTGASNSCSAIWDTVTLEKIGEYSNPYIRAEAFGKQVLALAKWFNNAFIIWESGGPGRAFGSTIQELGYSNYYLRRQEEAISKKQTNIPGVAQTRETKTAIMSAYRDAIENKKCINRSREALEETLEYVFGPDGCPVHSRASSKTDSSGAKENHGDRAMADALAFKSMQERSIKPIIQEPTTPVGCLQWRNDQREKDKKEQDRNGW